MEVDFSEQEQLLRAIRPPYLDERYWEEDHATLSSYSFKTSGVDSNGISADRVKNRPLKEAVNFLLSSKTGYVACFSVEDCRDIEAVVKSEPIPGNDYHCAIYRNVNGDKIKSSQAKRLAKRAKIVHPPDFYCKFT